MNLDDTLELSSILNLNGLDIPEDRKFINKENIIWLRRNLGIKNSDHVDFVRVMRLIYKIHIDYNE